MFTPSFPPLLSLSGVWSVISSPALMLTRSPPAALIKHPVAVWRLRLCCLHAPPTFLWPACAVSEGPAAWDASLNYLLFPTRSRGRQEIPLPRPGVTQPACPITPSRIWAARLQPEGRRSWLPRSSVDAFVPGLLMLLPRQQYTEIM